MIKNMKGTNFISDLSCKSNSAKTPSKDDLYNALSARIGKELLRKFSQSTVAICGLGGLGSNIAVSLARAGIGKLILIDFDIVDISNLNRQQYKISQIGTEKPKALKENLLEIAPYLDVETHFVKADESNYSKLLSNANVICEAFDVAEEKSKLANWVLENLPTKTLISGSGMAGIGSANKIKTRKITDNFYICGDEESDINQVGSLFAPRVMLCAAHQSHLALQIIGECVDLDF